MTIIWPWGIEELTVPHGRNRRKFVAFCFVVMFMAQHFLPINTRRKC